MSQADEIDQQAWSEWWQRTEGVDDEVLVQIDSAIELIHGRECSDEEVGQLFVVILRLAFGKGFQAGLIHGSRCRNN